MDTFIALLRGINVGGKNTLPKHALVRLAENLGAQRVRTYIQSGNAVFEATAPDASDFAKQIGTCIQQEFGFEPLVMLFQCKALEMAVANNPYPEAQVPGNFLHLGFMAAIPAQENWEKVTALKTASEQMRVVDRVLYLHVPEGIGRSKLAARAEELLGVDMTLRNWRTVCALLELAHQ